MSSFFSFHFNFFYENGKIDENDCSIANTVLWLVVQSSTDWATETFVRVSVSKCYILVYLFLSKQTASRSIIDEVTRKCLETRPYKMYNFSTKQKQKDTQSYFTDSTLNYLNFESRCLWFFTRIIYIQRI